MSNADKLLGAFGYVDTAVFGYIHHILNPYSELVFKVNSRLNRHYHTGLQNCFAAGVEGRHFVNLNADAVSQTVTEAALKAGVIYNVA